jgi:hypothetical protein
MNFLGHFSVSAWRTLTALLALTCVLATPGTLQADIILDLSPSSAASSGTGEFDVLLTNTGLTSQGVAAFSFGLTTSSSSGVNFTSAGYTSSSGGSSPPIYIFTGNSFDQTFSAPLSIGSLSGGTLPASSIVADDGTADGSAVNVASGSTVLLGSVTYTVASGTPAGPVTVSFDSTATSLTDGNFNSISFTANPGTITVTAAAVPEPSTFALCAIAAFGFLGFEWRRRRTLAANLPSA